MSCAWYESKRFSSAEVLEYGRHGISREKAIINIDLEAHICASVCKREHVFLRSEGFDSFETYQDSGLTGVKVLGRTRRKASSKYIR